MKGPILKTVVNRTLSYILATILPVLLVSASFALSKNAGPSLADTWLNIFSTAYNNRTSWEKSLLSDGFKDFHKKISHELRSAGLFASQFAACGNCSDFIQSWYDETLTSYILANYTIFTQEYEVRAFEHALGNVSVGQHLHPKAQPLTNEQVSMIDAVAIDLASSILIQLDEQTEAFGALWGVGMYMDSSLSNGPYDLMDDMQKIYKVFLCNPPSNPTYINTSKKNASSLLRSASGNAKMYWWNTHHIDLAHDVQSQTYQLTKSESNTSWFWQQNLESQSDLSIKFLKNTAYEKWGFFEEFCFWNDTYETLYRDTLDWIVREFDKKNLQCRREVPKHQFQPEHSTSSVWRELPTTFSGTTVSVSTRTPPFLQGAYHDAQKKQKKTKKQMAKESLSLLKWLFGRFGLEFPGNASFLIRQWDGHVPAQAVPGWLHAQREIKNELEKLNASHPKATDYHQFAWWEWMEHMGYIFQELNLHTTSLLRKEGDYELIHNHLDGKNECSA